MREARPLFALAQPRQRRAGECIAGLATVAAARTGQAIATAPRAQFGLVAMRTIGLRMQLLDQVGHGLARVAVLELLLQLLALVRV
ncbi:hypothetical protein JHS3_09610 [Jeongeupia sp. HS-3]|nr:hypothetical protein JHS3_09610 [Jeongeupia sp. HS-3]